MPGGGVEDQTVTTVVTAIAEQDLASRIAGELSAAPDIEVLAQSVDLSATFETLHELLPDVALLSDNVIGHDVVELCRRISDVLPICRVVLVVGEGEPDHAAIAAGAVGAFNASELTEGVADVVRRAARGEATVPKEWAARVLDEYAELETDGSGAAAPRTETLPRLTATEREVLGRIAKGATIESIAGLHEVPPRLVRLHAGFVLAKLNRARFDRDHAPGRT